MRSITKEGLLNGRRKVMEQKRFKRADAVATQYRVLCPYKRCEYMIVLRAVSKGEIVMCPNCRKEVRIDKVR